MFHSRYGGNLSEFTSTVYYLTTLFHSRYGGNLSEFTSTVYYLTTLTLMGTLSVQVHDGLRWLWWCELLMVGDSCGSFKLWWDDIAAGWG